ncbi:MAG: xanthine dehydrogenase family protein subunit M [Dehalococcoidia bacterium]|nr:xanthine dehydrogenase family protein subunit M [Dehalococcoidia bacterium]
MPEMEYVEPSSLSEVFDAFDRYGEDGRLIAGGTGLINLMKQRLVQPAALIALRKLSGSLGTITSENGSVRLGALVIHRQLEASPVVKQHIPLVAEAFGHVATIRIRNIATIGGGLAHGDPNLDPPSTYLALDAMVRIASRSGSRDVPIGEFYKDYYETAVQPGEVVTDLIVPNQPAGAGTAYIKFLPRTADDYATVSVAAVVTLSADKSRFQDVRIALGSVGSTHIRATAAEDLLKGRQVSPASLKSAAATVAEAVDPLTDVRGSGDYKRDMAVVWTRRALEQAVVKAGGKLE